MNQKVGANTSELFYYTGKYLKLLLIDTQNRECINADESRCIQRILVLTFTFLTEEIINYGKILVDCSNNTKSTKPIGLRQ